MYRLKELKAFKRDLVRSYRLRGLPLLNLKTLYRALEIGAVELTRKLCWRLPNLLNSYKFFGINSKFTVSTYSGLDHVQACSKLSDLYSKSSLIYGKGLFLNSDQLLLIRNRLILWLENRFKKFKVNLVVCPTFVTSKMLYVTGQLPKFKNQLFKINERYYLSPTGETQLGNLRPEKEILYATLSKCFRDELNYGKRHRGLIRNIEFEKYELFGFSHPSRARSNYLRSLGFIIDIVSNLGLKYRLIELPFKEIAFASKYTIDIEVWLPVSGIWLEISSVSDCDDYQTRRSQLKWKGVYPKTFNGSCLPIGRTLVALTENYRVDEIEKILKIFNL